MASSLASQLADIGTLDRERLQASTSKFRPSYLFQARQAASLSNEEIHSLGYNGFLALLDQDARLEQFENPLFGEKAKSTDRALLTKEENAKLNKTLASILRLLSSKFLLKNTGKVLEWLIRRFRINEFNVEDLLRAILPYHETPQFVQMLQILSLDDAKFASLQAVKTSLLPMPRHHLVMAMTKSQDLFRFVAGIVADYTRANCLHSSLTAFWTGAMLAYIKIAKILSSDHTTVLLPIIVLGMKSEDNDLRMGSLITLNHLAARVNLSGEALLLLAETILMRIKSMDSLEVVEAAMTTLVSICQTATDQLPRLSMEAARIPEPAFQILVDMCRYHDATGLLRPLLDTIITSATSETGIASDLFMLLATPDCPTQVTALGVSILLEASVQQDSVPTEFLDALLAIEQRLSGSVTLHDFIKADSDDGKKQRKVLRRVEELAMRAANSSESSAKVEISLALSSRKANIRAANVQQLLADIDTTTENGLASHIQDFLLHAMADESASVIKVLFEAEHRAVLRQLVTARANNVYKQVAEVIQHASSDLSLLHIDFLVTVFVSAVENPQDWRERIAREILWERLLISKSTKQFSIDLVNQVAELDQSAWPIFQHVSKYDGGDDHSVVVWNTQLVEQLSLSIQALPSDAQSAWEDFMLSNLRKSGGDAAPIHSLVLSRLLTEDKVSLLRRVLAVLASSTASGDDALLANGTSSSALAKLLYDKPSSNRCKQVCRSALEVSALRVASQSVAPESISWFSTTISTLEARLEHSDPWPFVLQHAYSLLHRLSDSTAFKAKILSNLLTHTLRDKAVAFLLGVACHTESSGLRTIALRDLNAMLHAVALDSEAQGQGWDFQVLLPGLLFTLSSGNKQTATTVMNVFDVLLAMALKQHEKAPVYGYDDFYGVNCNSLQYLDRTQYQRVLQIIVESRASLLLEPTGARLVVAQYLESSASEGKKSGKNALLAFVASHTQAWPNLKARTFLLSTLRGLLDSKRCQLLHPLLQEHLYTSLKIRALGGNDLMKYTDATMQCLAVRTLPDEMFDAMLGVLKATGAGPLLSSQRTAICGFLQSHQCAMLSLPQRLTLADEASTKSHNYRSLLQVLLRDEPTLIGMLRKAKLALSSELSEGQASKKSRGARGSLGQAALSRLATLLEHTHVSDTLASLELLSSFLDLLAGVIEYYTNLQINVDYYTQMICTASSAVTIQVQSTALADDGELRIGPVLEAIRISSNPATSNAALNLMSDLARLVPAQVAQNVMPIFTFMGTNTLQRDDSHSARVVEKTIDSIVPALVQHRQARTISHSDLVDDLGEVLRVFVDAASYVPRHRREHLFARFTEVLGPSIFLGPICSLMVDKVASRYTKSRDHSLLALPTALFQHFDGTVQIMALEQMWRDCQTRLEAVNTFAGDGSVSSRQSTPVTPTESPLLPVKASKRTVLATILLMIHLVSGKKFASDIQRMRASSASVENGLKSIFESALAIVAARPDRLSQKELGEITATTHDFLKALARVLNTQEMSEVMPLFIRQPASEVSEFGLDILTERLFSASVRKQMILSDVIITYIAFLSKHIAACKNKTKAIRAVARLRSLGAYCQEGELTSLNQALESVVEVLDGGHTEVRGSATFCTQALAFIGESIPRLGGRLIPNVRRVLVLASGCVHKTAVDAKPAALRSVALAAITIMEALVLCVPTFVAKDVKTILALCLDLEDMANIGADAVSAVRTNANRLISTCSKRLPAQAVIVAIFQLYDDSTVSKPSSVVNVIAALTRVIRYSNPQVISEQHKILSAKILEMLDTGKYDENSSTTIEGTEKNGIAAFMQLVLKLNEATFRPMYLKLMDWAFSEQSAATSTSRSRSKIFAKIINRMLAQMKEIAIPYFSLAFELLLQALQLADVASISRELMASVQQALELDVDNFWTDARLAKVVAALGQQVQKASDSQVPDSAHVNRLVGTLCRISVTKEDVLHDLHRTLLQKARSSEARVQLAAVSALQSMWHSEAQAELVSFKSESMPVLAELLETGGEVERQTKRLLATMAEGEEDAAMEGSSEADSEADDSDDEH